MDSLFFSSPIGLGHATRDIAVCQKLPDMQTRFVSGSGAVRIIGRYGFAVDSVYTPPRFDVSGGRLYNSPRWLWQYYRYYRDCKKTASDAIDRFSPPVVISDEDFASLAVSEDRDITSILITDVLETRFTKGVAGIIEKKMNRSMQDIIRKADAVILPEEGDDDGNLFRVGSIVRETSKSRSVLRDELGFDKKTIVISVGGTDAGKFLINRVMEIRDKIKRDVDYVLVSGPAIRDQYDIENLGFVKNLHEIIYAADLVISLAGKSTIDETRAYGTPGIFIPIKDHFEQEDNARDAGFLHEDIGRLDALVEEKLDESRRPVECGGASRAARIIADNL